MVIRLSADWPPDASRLLATPRPVRQRHRRSGCV